MKPNTFDYDLLCRQLAALVDGVPYKQANLANAAALIYTSLPDLNWAGFYLTEGKTLVLGPFQGKPACVEIPFGKGVCGTAAAARKSQRVANVHEYPGHIACDSASNAELVVPIIVGDAVVGVIDLDSNCYGRFTHTDRLGMEAFAKVLAEKVFA